MVYQIYGKSQRGQGKERRCVWVQPGQAVTIGPGLVVTFSVDRVGVEHCVWANVSTRRAVGYEGYIAPGNALDLSGWAGLIATPLALELHHGAVRHLLVEFVMVHADRRFAPR